MGIDANDLGYHHAVPVFAGAVNGPNLESRVGQTLRHVVN